MSLRRLPYLTLILILLITSACVPVQPAVEQGTVPGAAVEAAPAAPEAAAPAEPEASSILDGRWDGAISVAGMELQVVVRFATADGVTTGTVDIPQQGATGLPLHEIEVNPPEVSFSMLEDPQTARFSGALGEDGVLAGSFAQSGVEGTFTLQRSVPVDEAADDEAAAAVAPAPEASGVYTDASGLFTVPIPTNWTAETKEGYGVLTSPEGGITVFVAAVENDDLKDAIDSTWRSIDPTFDFEIDDEVEEPANRVDRAMTLVYDTGSDEDIAMGGGWQLDGVSYLVLVRGDTNTFARRNAQLSIIMTGYDILAVEKDDLSDVAPGALTEADIADLEAYIAQVMEAFEVPGMAMALVQDGEVVYSQGFGVRNESGAPMTTDTHLMIGSTGKTMTTLLMGILVDEGRMDWDTPVVEVLPNFAVKDPELTQELTMRNLVCACTGVPRRDMEFLFNADELTAEDIVQSLATFEFFTEFGEAFQYSNQMVATAGYAVGAVAGGQWGDLYNAYATALQERVLDPLGMQNTTLSFTEVLARDLYAIPHGMTLEGSYEVISLELEEVLTPIAPAGGQWSTVDDMARYMIFELNKGVTPDGERLVSEKNLQETWQPQVPISADTSYGLGWMVGEWKGVQMIEHGGNTLGMTSDFSFLPEKGVGIVILSNAQGANGLGQAVRYYLLEQLFGLEHESIDDVQFGLEQMARAFEEMGKTLDREFDPAPVEPYYGEYANEALGSIRIGPGEEAGSIVIDAGEFVTHILPSLEDDGSIKEWLTFDAPLMGLPVKFSGADEGAPRVTVGANVAEYIFTPVE